MIHAEVLREESVVCGGSSVLVLVIGRERRARVWEYVVGETEMRIWVVGIESTQPVQDFAFRRMGRGRPG